jgi:hypothetical protein
MDEIDRTCKKFAKNVGPKADRKILLGALGIDRRVILK